MPVFLLNLAHADFAAGKGTFPVDSGRAGRVLGGIARISLMLGAAATLAAAVAYFHQVSAKEDLLASVRIITATVSGCEGPGRFEHIRFHYKVDGKQYDQNAYLRRSVFIGSSGLTDACAAPTVRLEYLAGDPNRWSIAPLSPITREEREAEISAVYVTVGPMFLFVAGVFSFTVLVLKNRKEKQEQLAREGVILPAELIKVSEDMNDESVYNIRAEYRFLNPRAEVVTGRNSGIRLDLKKKDYPPAGTPMLVLYVSDDLFEAL
jgi:hypothetical protein